SQKQALGSLFQEKKMPLIAAGLAAAVMGGYISMLAMSMVQGPCDEDCLSSTPSGRPLDLRQGQISALMFDKDLNRPETLMGVKSLRKLMGGLARGHVLEVAVGTGRNIEYVDWDEIRASAPPVPVWTEDGRVITPEVKDSQQLHKERVARRIEAGKKGLTLPGDEAPEVVSYTGVDVSTDVLEVAWGKLRKAVPDLVPRRRRRSAQEQQQEHKAATGTPPAAQAVVASPGPVDESLVANLGHGRIRLFQSDAQLHLPSPPAMTSHDGSRVLPAPQYYDTIMQNFGLCSVADPQHLLATMASKLRPESGRIYLMEHGRGSYGWLNDLLDKFAPSHFARYGCWWNRDIEQIVRQAEQEVPGLEVVRIHRPLVLQGGTTLWIELKVSSR
ncbi:hypothetical protein BD289DRAFT_354554, partial [Coniella lustricola]